MTQETIDARLREQLDDLAERMKPEPLHPDLAQYLNDTVLGPYVRHPLVFGSAHFPAPLNRMYEQKQEQLAEARAAGDWRRYFWLHERPYRLSTLGALFDSHVLTVELLRELLPEQWTDTELPHGFGALPRRLFTAAGFLTDAPDAWAALPETLTVYRGGRPRIRPTTREISWTLDHERATWFAYRFAAGGGSVWTGTVEKRHVLGYFEGRNEAEVLVVPTRITNMTLARKAGT